MAKAGAPPSKEGWHLIRPGTKQRKVQFDLLLRQWEVLGQSWSMARWDSAWELDV